MTRTGLAAGNKSYDTVRRALDIISGDVKIPDILPVLVKPNMVSDHLDLAATPVEAVRATLDFLTGLGVSKFIIGEGSSQSGDTMGAFERFGYLALKDDYDIEFRDLNQDDFVTFDILGDNLSWVKVRLARSGFDAYVVSVGRMKTHIRVGVTLSIKNLAIGSILNADRLPSDKGGFVCHAPKEMNLSLTRLTKAIYPHLAVIDGVVGMEGNGPIDGTPVSSGMALAGTDALAVDVTAARLMGFDPRTIGYLWYLSKLRNLACGDIQISGEDVSGQRQQFKAPDRFPELLNWWVEDWQAYVNKG